MGNHKAKVHAGVQDQGCSSCHRHREVQWSDVTAELVVATVRWPAGCAMSAGGWKRWRGARTSPYALAGLVRVPLRCGRLGSGVSRWQFLSSVARPDFLVAGTVTGVRVAGAHHLATADGPPPLGTIVES